ncbi:hypothetical protein, partial [Saccharothrix sp. ST-888]|uniref:hypothetical protein n=1 Tax=Saccharothrix sp. ST-888 TaxID=1427391 RepID=UPI0005ED0825
PKLALTYLNDAASHARLVAGRWPSAAVTYPRYAVALSEFTAPTLRHEDRRPRGRRAEGRGHPGGRDEVRGDRHRHRAGRRAVAADQLAQPLVRAAVQRAGQGGGQE